MRNYNQIVNIFLHLPYGVSSIPAESELLKKYALFPNEAIYLVDYKLAQIEPLTKNFEAITGITVPSSKDVTVLYDHVHPQHLNPFLSYIERLLKYGLSTQEHRLLPEQDFNMSIYKTIRGKTILKSTTLLGYDTKNNCRYSIGKLMDVTNLISDQGFNYMFSGPNQNKAEAYFRNLIELQFLTKKELSILNYVGKGLSSPRIASLLHISRHTVDTHKRNIIRKLEASNSIDAYNKAKDLGLSF